MARYTWTVAGWHHRPHSNPEWESQDASGVIEVDEAESDAGDALVAVITGFLPGGSPAGLEETVPWDLISLDREITLTFRPDNKPGKEG